MPDREKLIELLKETSIKAGSYGQQADYLIDRGVTFATDNNVGHKWIPVTERLPLNDTYILVTTDGVVVPAYWHNDRFYAFTANGVATVGGVTHWMPLPTAPKEA